MTTSSGSRKCERCRSTSVGPTDLSFCCHPGEGRDLSLNTHACHMLPDRREHEEWIPAFAGMTTRGGSLKSLRQRRSNWNDYLIRSPKMRALEIDFSRP